MTQAVLYRPGPPRWELKTITTLLRNRLAGKVHSAFLFGSYARGDADSDSDLDLIAVMDTELPSHRRASCLDEVTDGLGAVDLIVYTPAELAALERAPTAFWHYARQSLIQVI